MRIIARTDTLFITPRRRQSKTLILSTNVDQKSIETEFSIVICRRLSIVNPFLAILIRVRRLLRAFSIAAYPVCLSNSAPALCIAGCCFVFKL